MGTEEDKPNQGEDASAYDRKIKILKQAVDTNKAMYRNKLEILKHKLIDEVKLK